MMIDALRAAAHLPDAELLPRAHTLTAAEREATTRLIAVLAVVDARRLYLGQGCSSLFSYCTQVLHLSEHAAYSRIKAARAARRFPVILDRLAEGSLHLTAVSDAFEADRWFGADMVREVSSGRDFAANADCASR